ncbi:MAG: ATP-grasp domain-containing protein [Candidatus Omnitrophota bacterium]
MKVLIAISRENNARQDNADASRCADSIGAALQKKSISVDCLFIEPGDFLKPEKEIIKKIKSANPDCVFNLFEGFSYDAQREIDFAIILEKSNIPFTGSTSKVLRKCLDKNSCKNILIKAGLPVPAGICLKPGEGFSANKLELPVFIKPCCEDASVGIDKDSLVFNQENLDNAIKLKLQNHPEGIIIEEFLSGNEFNVSFIGRPPYEMLGVSVMDYAKVKAQKPFMSYEAKWEEQSADFNKLIPRVIEKNAYGTLEKEIVDLCVKAAQAIGCEGYFRVDLRQNNNKIFIIDINPNPDINTDSGFARQAYSAGYNYEEIINKIVCLAIKA